MNHNYQTEQKLRDKARADLARAEYAMEIAEQAIKDVCYRLKRISHNKCVNVIGRRKARESLRAVNRIMNSVNKISCK